MIYLRARHYNPNNGRFTQRDSFAGKIEDPLSLNLYIYCHNNPIIGIDPSGHSVTRDWANEWYGYKNDFFNYNKKDYKDNWKINWFNSCMGEILNDNYDKLKTEVKCDVKKVATCQKLGVDKMRSFTSQLNITKSIGINANLVTGIWSFNGSVGLSIDSKGNIGIQNNKGIGIGTGTPSVSAMLYNNTTNARDIYAMEGMGVEIGGSVSTGVVGGGGEFTMGFADESLNKVSVFGINQSAGLVAPPSPIGAEGHVQWGETNTLWGVNLYDEYNDFYEKIMAW